MDTVNYTIETQGGPIVNGLTIIECTDRVLLFEVDLKTKWCEILGFFGDAGIGIGCTKRSVHYAEGEKDEWTEIRFHVEPEWRFFACELCRYTLRVCMIKP